MFQNFRLSMAWVHTWFGLVLGFVLMVCFFFGALSVFDREIDRWAMPATRFEPQPLPSFEKVLLPALERIPAPAKELTALTGRADNASPERLGNVDSWWVYTTHRDPVLSAYAGYKLPHAKNPEARVWAEASIDPRTGLAVSENQLPVGSEFFYPLHHNLNFLWLDLGIWIVALAALAMLAALISGLVMHRKIFREFFTFRSKKTVQRSTLDLHNLTGVLALPFHFFFAFTGLVMFAGVYFPVTETQLKPLRELHQKLQTTESGLPHDRAGIAAPTASVDAMIAEARHRWMARGMAGEVGLLKVDFIGDANGYVSIYRAGTDRIALVGDGIHFKSSTGEVLREDPSRTAAENINEFLTGLHLQHFRHWLLRWLYLVGGLMGCVCIATGFIFFVEKRKKQHARQGSRGVQVVDALAVTMVTGMLIAALGILIANRLLPEILPAGRPMHGELEPYAFWAAWLLALTHAFMRSAPVSQGQINPAWREQCWAIAFMAVLAAALNWLTTGDHLIKTVSEAYWPVAGVDLFLLATAALAVVAARKLRARAEAFKHLKRMEAVHA